MNKKDKGLYICPNQHMYNANKYGDTCPNCGAKQPPKMKSQKEYETELLLPRNQWSIGYLVCITGVNKGRPYKITMGNNRIGRSKTMEISIQGDTSIAQENHALISYYEDQHIATIKMGTSSGLVHLNEELVLGEYALQNGDTIKIGDVLFRYATFCNKERNWDNLFGDILSNIEGGTYGEC